MVKNPHKSRLKRLTKMELNKIIEKLPAHVKEAIRPEWTRPPSKGRKQGPTPKKLPKKKK